MTRSTPPILYTLALLTALVLFAPSARADLSPLRVQNGVIVNAEGEAVILRGCNLGNWLLIEPWMWAVYDDSIPDHATVRRILTDRFGEPEADRLLDLHREHWITQRDLDLIASFGFNAVRVPFYANIFESPEAEFRIRDGSFRWLDKLMRMADQAGIYVVLDMHGAPGGQSTDAPSGDVTQNNLWFNDRNKERMAWLWQRIARRYAHRAVFAGYDLLNEPYGNFSTDYRNEMLEIVGRSHDAIRLIDPDQPIWAPGTLEGSAFYGDPTDRGWTGTGVTEHFYPGLFDGNEPTLGNIARFIEHTLGSREHQATTNATPFMWGEFNPIFEDQGGDQAIRIFYDAAADAGFAAFMWSYKLVKPQGGVQGENWYLVTNQHALPSLNLRTASKASIESYFTNMSTIPLAPDEDLRTLLTDPSPALLALPAVHEAYFAPPTTDLAPGWSAHDVGNDTRPGGQHFDASSVTLYAGGLDFTSNADTFRFISQPAGTNTAISAVIERFDATSRYAQAGVMLRAGTGSQSAHVFVGAFPDGRVFVKSRRGTGFGTDQTLIGYMQFPIGVAVARVGAQYQARVTDADGQWFTVPVDQAVNLGSAPRVGLAATANTRDSLATIDYTNVAVGTSLGTLAPTPATDTPDLLANAGFEASGGGNAASGWLHEGERFWRQTGWTPRRDGDALIGYRHWETQGNNPSSVSQTLFGLTPGQEYVFSVYCNQDSVDPGEANASLVRLVVETTDAGARVLESRRFEPGQIATGQSWSRLHLPFRATATTARVRIEVYPDTSGATRDGAVKFDDATLVTGG